MLLLAPDFTEYLMEFSVFDELQSDIDFTEIVPSVGRGKLFIPRQEKVNAYVDKILFKVESSSNNSFYYRGPVGSGKVRKYI